MRISDWSSDVCSSDLARLRVSGRAARADAVHFQRLRLRLEAQRLRARFKLRDHVEVLEFGRSVAAIADQERHRVLRRARVVAGDEGIDRFRSEEHTSELQSLMRISYAVFCLKKKK